MTLLLRTPTGLLRRAFTAPRDAVRALGVGNRTLDYSASPQFRDGIFHNRMPASLMVEGTSRSGMAKDFATKGRTGKPARPVEVERTELPEQAADLAVTWLGHATTLLEIEGHWVLTDPVWSERVSPSQAVGPRRLHPTTMPLHELPALTAVLISHDHYDHLDTDTIDVLREVQDVPFVVPLGIGEHLLRWGVPADRVIELDWDASTEVGGLTLTCTEARHFSGRFLGGNTSLWSSWVIAGERRRVWFGGDSGYTDAFAGLGEAHGPFDLTVLPIGAYDVRWRDVHMDPEEAVRAHLHGRGDVLLPIHWATFDLAFHEWSAPVEWLVEEAAEHDVRLALPRPGRRVDLDSQGAGELPVEPWWRAFS